MCPGVGSGLEPEPGPLLGLRLGTDPALDHDQREVPGCFRWRHEVYHRAAEGDTRPGTPLLGERERSQVSQS